LKKKRSMRETHTFEYAVIRVVPKVEREEFLNVGVILYCRKHAFLHTRISVDEKKLRALSDGVDISELNEHLHAFETISDGSAESPIAKLDIASRFRWLTAARSTIVQCSKVHPGICSDPLEKLNSLFRQYVA